MVMDVWLDAIHKGLQCFNSILEYSNEYWVTSEKYEENILWLSYTAPVNRQTGLERDLNSYQSQSQQFFCWC